MIVCVYRAVTQSYTPQKKEDKLSPYVPPDLVNESLLQKGAETR